MRYKVRITGKGGRWTHCVEPPIAKRGGRVSEHVAGGGLLPGLQSSLSKNSYISCFGCRLLDIINQL